MEKLINALNTQNDYNVAILFKEITKIKFVCTNPEHHCGYLYNEDTGLYSLVGVNVLGSIIRKELNDYLCQMLRDNKEQHLFKAYTNLINKVGCQQFKSNTAKSFIEICDVQQDFDNQLDSNPDVINFTNGLVELKTGIFRKRTSDDKISKTLDYAYSEAINDSELQFIKTTLKRICNDDEELYNFILSWNAYCLTGETKLQKFCCIIGHSASNGKSTAAKMFDAAFPIYSRKLNKDTFTIGYPKRHKEFAEVKAPIRYCYIEEINRSKVDIDVLKDFVDGGKLSNEIMFGTQENILLQCKLNLIGNNYMNFDNDEGQFRRGLHVEMNTKFVDKIEGAPKKGTYLKDTTLTARMKTNEFKLSYFHLLLPEVIKYYQRGLYAYKPATEKYQELCLENDKMRQFIDQFIEITENNKDRIHKSDFLESYQTHYKLRNLSWNNLVNDVKRVGLEYDRMAKLQGLRGCIVGVKYKQTTFDDHEEVMEQEIQSPLDAFVEPPQAKELECDPIQREYEKLMAKIASQKPKTKTKPKVEAEVVNAVQSLLGLEL